ncbi:MAG: hypothetical protein JSV30_06200 [Candidatus Omnitrophota bacterium]|nr:MAG: hypothetical protein JSV30_06200 [Candidatus Omnitrophota bacterium]
MSLSAQAQKPWAHSAHRFGNKKAQSLVELATFGTVLLFALTLLLRYGMSANQQQNMRMQTFRKAFVRARSYDYKARYSRYSEGDKNDPLFQFHQSDIWWQQAIAAQNPMNFVSSDECLDPGWEYENKILTDSGELVNPPLPSNHWRTVNYAVVEDKPVFSASGILPIAERAPAMAITEATCSIDLFMNPGYGDKRALSRAEYEINGKRYSFTAAGYKEVTLTNGKLENGSPIIIKEDIEDWNGQGKCWRPKEVKVLKAGDIANVDDDPYEETVMEAKTSVLEVIDDEGNQVKVVNSEKNIIELYFSIDYVDENGSYAGTGHRKGRYTLSEEEIGAAAKDFIEINVCLGSVYDGADADEKYMYRKEKIKVIGWKNELKVLDQQEGEVFAERINPITGEEEKGGLLGSYNKKTEVNASTLERKENALGIETIEDINAREIFNRTIKTRDGDHNVQSSFSTQKTTTWDTPHK